MARRTCFNFAGARRGRSPRRGVAAVEFALTAPILFLFLFAAFEFTWTNVLRHTADNAAYEAARRAILPGATADDVRATANQLLRIIGARKAVVTVEPGNLDVGTRQIRTRIEVPMNANSLIAGKFMRNKSLVSTSTMRTERVSTR